MTDRELMQQALEALEYEADRGNDDGYRPLRDALRERLAQPVREPVAWVLPDDLRILKSGNCGEMIVYGYQRNKLADDPNEAAIPLYAAPVRTKDLTGQDLCDLEVAVGWKGDSHDFDVIVKAVIAKFKEENNVK